MCLECKRQFLVSGLPKLESMNLQYTYGEGNTELCTYMEEIAYSLSLLYVTYHLVRLQSNANVTIIYFEDYIIAYFLIV